MFHINTRKELILFKNFPYYPYFEDNKKKQYLHKLNSLQPTFSNKQHSEILAENPLSFRIIGIISFALSIAKQNHSN